MTMKHFHLIVAASVLLAGCAGNRIDFDACGQIDAVQVVVSAESSGKILWLGIDEGDRLAKGERAGVIDTMQISLSLTELNRRMAGAATKIVDIPRQLAPQYSQLENLERDRERFTALLASNAGTQKQVDDNASQISVLKGQIAAQEQTFAQNNETVRSEISIYEAQIAQKRDQLDKCVITSPVDGTVLVKYAEEGEMVTSGKPVFKIADMSDVYVRAYFTTAQLSGIKLGDRMEVIPDDGTDSPRHYEGTVTWISDEAEFTPKNIQTRDERADLVYAVKVSVRNDGYLRLGMYAYVRKIGK